MKPQLHKLQFSTDASFLYKNLECSFFPNPWHFHKEYELVLINKSQGTRFIGDKVSHFEEGNLTLIGSNIPHLYRNSEKYFSKDSNLKANSIFIHFTIDFLGKKFFQIPEMELVLKVLQKSSRVLEIHGRTKKLVKDKLIDMTEQRPPERLVSLLGILLLLAHSKDLKTILSPKFSANTIGDTERINKVFEFILKNYTHEIYVQEIASQLNMSVASFSRYFKHHARKTFSNYVTEIRIGHACRLLMENNHSISEISYHSGFDNRSNFYRHFNKVVGMIPKEYKSRFLETIR